MSRLKELDPAEMTAEQQQVLDAIAAGPRGPVRGGPFNVWLRSPKLANPAQELGAFARYNTLFEPRLSELAILITARQWTAQYEWAAHEPHALKGGLKPAVIDAIRRREQPVFDQQDEQVLYDFCTTLYAKHKVDDVTYKAALDQFGEQGVVELVALLGYYTLVSFTLNTFEVAAPGEQPLSSD